MVLCTSRKKNASWNSISIEFSLLVYLWWFFKGTHWKNDALKMTLIGGGEYNTRGRIKIDKQQLQISRKGRKWILPRSNLKKIDGFQMGYFSFLFPIQNIKHLMCPWKWWTKKRWRPISIQWALMPHRRAPKWLKWLPQ